MEFLDPSADLSAGGGVDREPLRRGLSRRSCRRPPRWLQSKAAARAERDEVALGNWVKQDCCGKNAPPGCSDRLHRRGGIPDGPLGAAQSEPARSNPGSTTRPLAAQGLGDWRRRTPPKRRRVRANFRLHPEAHHWACSCCLSSRSCCVRCACPSSWVGDSTPRTPGSRAEGLPRAGAAPAGRSPAASVCPGAQSGRTDLGLQSQPDGQLRPGRARRVGRPNRFGHLRRARPDTAAVLSRALPSFFTSQIGHYLRIAAGERAAAR